jgi:O-antigen ligase
MENTLTWKNCNNSDSLQDKVLKALIYLIPLTLLDAIGKTSLRVSPFEFATIIFFIIIIFTILMNDRICFKGHWSGLFLLILLLVALLSTLHSIYLNSDHSLLIHWFGQYAFRIGLALLIVLALYNVKNGTGLIINSSAVINIIIIVVVATFTLVKFNLEVFRHVNQLVRLPQLRFLKYTIFGDPNTLSAFITISFPLAFFKFSRFNSKKFLLILTLFNVLAIVSCRSRMHIFIFSLEVFVLFLFLQVSFYYKVGLSGLVIVLLGVLLVVLAPRVKEKLEIYSVTKSSVRVAMIRSAFAAIEERPFLGHGPGKAKEAINRYDFINEFYSTWQNRPVERYLGLHNMILTIAVDVGVPGALGFVACMVGVVWCGLRRLKFLLADEEKLLLLAVVVGVCAWLLGGLTRAMISNNLGWILFGTLFYCVGVVGFGRDIQGVLVLEGAGKGVF